MSATFADFHQRAYIRQTGNGLPQISDCRNISVCEHPTINENTKNRYTTLPFQVQSVPITTKVELEPRSWRGVLDSTLCDKVCQLLATGRWFSPVTPVSSTNKTDRHDLTEILLKVALNTIHQNLFRSRSHKSFGYDFHSRVTNSSIPSERCICFNDTLIGSWMFFLFRV